MFRNHTVFILGAGASFEVGMPLGEKLTELIAGKVHLTEDTIGHIHGDSLLRSCLLQKTKEDGATIDFRQYFNACNLMHSGVLFSKSIDNFLYAHSENKAVQLCGKLAIASIILEKEQGSKLYFDQSNAFNTLNAMSLKDSWFPELFALLQRNRPRGSELQLFDGIGIVNFNYDRCVEHFFYNAVRSYYGLEHDQAKEVASSLNIIHPYGSVGNLLWHGNGFAFGSKPTTSNIQYAANRIRTYNDEISDQTILKSLSEMLVDVKTIIFLGFGFHQQNLDLLEKCSLRAEQIFATVFKRSEDDKKVIESKLRKFLSERTRLSIKAIRLLDKDCVTAFREQGLLWSQNS